MKVYGNEVTVMFDDYRRPFDDEHRGAIYNTPTFGLHAQMVAGGWTNPNPNWVQITQQEHGHLLATANAVARDLDAAVGAENLAVHRGALSLSAHVGKGYVFEVDDVEEVFAIIFTSDMIFDFDVVEPPYLAKIQEVASSHLLNLTWKLVGYRADRFYFHFTMWRPLF